MKTIDTSNFNKIMLKLASPEEIRKWSFGEVQKPETINYRTGRSERGGLFDERVFGPEKDYECYCGKYRRIRYKDIICEKCGVEVGLSIVRRERMGHIELASPVAHIWFLRGVPSRMSILLQLTIADLEKVIYFAGYIITRVHEAEKESIIFNLEQEFKNKIKSTSDEPTREKLKELLLQSKKDISEIVPFKVLTGNTYHQFSLKYGTCFDAGIGAEAIYQIFKEMDLVALEKKLKENLSKTSAIEREKSQKRIGLVRSLIKSGVRPEWMFLTVIPVIPPLLRPIVGLDGGRYATSDINDLYRRVINRNNRLAKLKEIGAPDVIQRNEKRILQEAVDALIDNSISRQGDSQAMSQSQKRALKSLADNLKSKQGLLRQNLLGKRVDYSGRSVIVVGPRLSLSQCGLPKLMALELFRPFVIAKILEREIAHNIRGANRLIEEKTPEVWAILEEVIQGKFVMLNRAPTLHRLGIQAFNPILIEGDAIQLHPLVCSAYNADFDGDTMAVYLPLSVEAQLEAKHLIAATNNLLKPQNGEPIVNPSKDIVLGIFWMTKNVENEKGEGMYFSSPQEAILAHDFGVISIRSKIKVMGDDGIKYAEFKGQPFETTVGRLMFNSVLPEDLPYMNAEMNQKRLSDLVDDLIHHLGIKETPAIIDKIKDFGYKYATISGVTWSLDNVKVPEMKKEIVASARKEESKMLEDLANGLVTEEEKQAKIIEIWQEAKSKIEKALPGTLDKNGSAFDIVTSGARGSVGQLAQLAGMTGLINNVSGEILDFPIIPSYTEGLSPLDYFITTHGARKGLADTALQTARAGYLTRKLVDVAQDIRITEEDCGTKEYKTVRAENIGGIEIPLQKVIKGRMLAKDITDENGNVIFKKGLLIKKDIAASIEKAGIKEVCVRTPLLCKTLHGLCRNCYGLDFGRDRMVQMGEAVGIVAAQAIGEPGTQLTLRTFHQGGVAGVDITQGLPRVEEIFEKRAPKNPAVVSRTNGEVFEITINDAKEKVIRILTDDKTTSKSKTIEYVLAPKRNPIVTMGQQIVAGQLITDGSADIEEIFEFGGKEMAEEYIIHEISKIYELQGASTSRKHIEIIVKQMFSRRQITEGGDTEFSPGELVEYIEFIEENEKAEKLGEMPSKCKEVVKGIVEVALTTKSWLSAASFQHTNKVLISSAISGKVDELRGLKENVIIGGIIPVGTGINKDYVVFPKDNEEVDNNI